jgi:Ran GTPase-activating protein 1
LRHLILNNNGLGPAAGVLIADALTKLAAKKAEARQKGTQVPNLETIICGRNRLENGSMAAWAKCYAAHTGVKEIKMVQNGIRQEGVTHLIREGLVHLKDLQVLDLQDNTFTALGARALADVVGTWTELRELGVGDSLLSARGGVMLGEALQKGNHKKIEVLRLQYNEVDAKGVKAISVAVDKLPMLRRLELNGNKFSEDNKDIDSIREELHARAEKAGVEMEEIDDNEDWGIDELDELEEESDEEEEEDEKEEDGEEGVEVEEKAARQIAADQQAEEENVAGEKDKEVDELADIMGKTTIK